jgi:cyclic-di-AMP phosphodiesterase PgpH
MSFKGQDKLFGLLNINILRWVLLIAVCILTFAALILPIAIRPSNYQIKVGDVASQDIQAPRTLTFKSKILSDQAKKDAEQSISKVYLPADPTIARSQIEKLRMVLNFISTVRADPYSNVNLKLSDIAGISEIIINPVLSKQILDLSDTRWESIKQETLNVLEQTMRNTIREGQIQEAIRNVPTLVSFSLPPEQAAIVVGIVTQFVVPNSLYSEQFTQEARLEASKSISQVERKFVAGQTIVQRGQIITSLNIEALEEFGLVQPRRDDQEVMAAGIIVFLIGGFVTIYFNRRKSGLMRNLRSLLVIAITFVVFIYGARLVIPNRTILPYLYPMAAYGMAIASLFNIEIGLVFSLALSILSAFNLPNSLDLTLFFVLSSLVSVLVLGKGRRLASFFWAGLSVAAAGSAVILAYRLPNAFTDWIGIATLLVASLVNGLASASLALLLQYLFSQLLGVTTALQLLEISRPDHPMLQYMLRNAPGSYQHSLQVANLAEQAAEAIGADALLVRVGAIYHDTGKTTNPSFFIENQVPGNINPHDDLDPIVSAATIIRHVPDGVQLGKKFRLPSRIQDFIREHHGTLITRYQYTKAIQAVGGDPSQIDLESFRYPGPRPQSRETALIMLADGCEARARAEIPKNEDDLRALIKKVFDYCVSEGQLDDTTLTLRDLNVAKESFINTLKNTYHPRIQYPEYRPSSQQLNDSPELKREFPAGDVTPTTPTK